VSIRLSIHDSNACDRTRGSRALDEFANGIENAGEGGVTKLYLS